MEANNMVRQSSAKQARFVREYAVDCNGAAAAVRAGYSPRSAKVTASRLLTKANVQRALQQIQQVDAERLALSREAVIDQLQDAIELARVKQDPMAMIVGLRELGRMMGYYGRRVSDIECGCREFREDGEFVFDAGR